MEWMGSENVHVDKLPDFILEYIFTLLNSYDDLDSARLVCQRWRRVANTAIALMQRMFRRCDQFKWSVYEPILHSGPFLAERCSHSACYHDGMKSMYIFGGCTATYTAFNDLWRFDLSTYRWERVLITRAPFPSPKALATLALYGDDLLLFGGFSKSSPNPIHQTSTFYNELHLYSTSKNQWINILTENTAPKLASHSVSVVGDSMIVFGGSMGNCSSNELWVLDIPGRVWLQPQMLECRKPAPRYGHSQILLDDKHLLIAGGCGGPNMIYSDIWMLTFDISLSSGWKWSEVKITNPEMSAPQMWCHAACRVGQNMLVLSRPLKNQMVGSCFRDMSLTSRPTPLTARSALVTERLVAETVALRSGAVARSIKPVATDSGGEPSSAEKGSLLSAATRRRGLLSSKSLDEKGEVTTVGVVGNPSADNKGVGAVRNMELQRARSIPAIIVGEIPTLVVTSSETYAHSNRPSSPSSHCNLEASRPVQDEDKMCEMEMNCEAATGPSTSSLRDDVRQLMFSKTASVPAGHSSEKNLRSLEIASALENEIKCFGSSELDRYSSNNGSCSSASTSWSRLSRSSSPGRNAASVGPDSGASSPEEASRKSSSGSSSGSQRHRVRRSSSEFCSGRRPLCVYILDTSKVVSDGCASWQQQDVEVNAPEDTILYSICTGRGEVIMFGGMRSDGTMEGLSPFTHSINNKTFILRPLYSL